MNAKKISDWKKLSELKGLHDLSNPPKEIYYIGTWGPEIFKDCTAVVGSRKMTDYGSRAVEKIVTKLVFERKTVVSGFMYGVDQYAHQVCLEQGGKTVSVLGWGVDWPLAGYDKQLAEKIIASGGLLLSEWKSQRPTLWTFPARNRIIAALSKDVIIVEAAEKSGSLITARLAIKLKRKLWAVPGPITSRTSVGTNSLIANKQACLWIGETLSKKKIGGFDDPVLSLLENESLAADEIARKLDKSVSEIGAKLSLLLLDGSISERGGKYFLRDAD